ncbi:DsbE family thiol:disulfide interchange protein [Candidatus Endowatersipora endosymbiont of Watersipora subatra]|uniref:DsbE family thiol:disulfide interchange protein n=1 Tax=Candidatus Endowatersipora endosymbiont of Watersipora subatra TaxID=3077946 RepID=UPI00312CA114
MKDSVIKSPARIIFRFIPFVIFSGLAVVFFIQLNSASKISDLSSVLIGKQVPEFDLPGLKGLNHKGIPILGLSDSSLVGQPSLINIFASWCFPCHEEHPFLMSLGKEGIIDVLGINYKDKTGNALRFLGGLGNPYKRVGVDQDGDVAIDWGVYGIPETFLVDSSGVIRHKIVGPINESNIDLLKEEIIKMIK